ncbi:hypothetical protein MBANPS3_012475, partial [Mucor bainieri]
MINVISFAVIVLALLLLFLTPVGLCLLLASPFWTVGMEIVFHFVDNQYPGKVVAAVSAVVAILFVGIVRFIWVVLLLQGAPAQDDEAVSAGHRHVSAGVASGKFGSSSSVNCSRFDHSHHEYRSLVGGACPSLTSPENDEDSAGLFSDKSRMNKVEEGAAACERIPNATMLASDARRLPLSALNAAAVDKESRGLAVPRADGVANASVHSPQVDGCRDSPSGVTAGSTGLSDGAFVASAAHVAGMTEAVDASCPVGGCRVAGPAEPFGNAVASVPSAAAFSGAEDGVAAATCSSRDAHAVGALGGASGTCAGSAGATVLGATTFGDAKAVGGSVLGAASSGVAFAGARSRAWLVPPFARSFGGAVSASLLGVKRSSDVELPAFAGQKQAKKRRVVSANDGSFLLPRPMLGVGTAAVSVLGGTAAAAATTTATTEVNDPWLTAAMDLDTPLDFAASSDMECDVEEPIVATDDMDLDDPSMASPMLWEPLLAMANPSVASPGSLPSVSAATMTAAPSAVLASASASAALTTAEPRRIARPRGPSAHRRLAASAIVAAQQHQQAAAASSTSTVRDAQVLSAAAATTPTTPIAAPAIAAEIATTTTTTTTAAATSSTAANNTSDSQHNSDDLSDPAQRPQVEDFGFNAEEILELL